MRLWAQAARRGAGSVSSQTIATGSIPVSKAAHSAGVRL